MSTRDWLSGLFSTLFNALHVTSNVKNMQSARMGLQRTSARATYYTYYKHLCELPWITSASDWFDGLWKEKLVKAVAQFPSQTYFKEQRSVWPEGVVWGID